MSIAIKSTRAQILATGNAFTGNGLVQLYVDENNDIVFIVETTVKEETVRTLKTVVQSNEMILALTQYSTKGPTVAINQNTTDIADEDISTNYKDEGYYTIGFPEGTFTGKALAIIIGNTSINNPVIFSAYKEDDENIAIKTYNIVGAAYKNNLLNDTTLSISIFDAVV